MVHDPNRPQHGGPQTVPNSYVLVSTDPNNFDAMIRDVDALIKKEGAKAVWTEKLDVIGIAIISCDDAFALKLTQLPTVGSVEREHRADIQDLTDSKPATRVKPRKPGGPGM